MENNTSASKVPVTIITGFLGSGKTTLINYLLEEVGPHEKLAIIKNEIGDIAVDSKIIRGKNIIMKELLNGCVCCTLVGDLESSMKELVDTVHPERIVIEASGAANPAILAVNLDRMNFVKRDMIITVVDAVNFLGYKNKSVVTELQQKFTDMVVLNKVSLATDDQIEKVLDDIYEIRPGIPVVKTATGRVDPNIVFGVSSPHKHVEIPVSIHDPELHEHHLNEDDIEYFSFKEDLKLDRECVEKVLNNLSEEYYRVKGFIWLGNDIKPSLVNFVCNRWDIVPLDEVPSDLKPSQNKLAFIGKGIKRYEAKVSERLTNQCHAT